MVARIDAARPAVVSCLIVLLASCSSDGGSDSPSPSAPPSTTASETPEPSPTEDPELAWLSDLNGQQLHAEPFGDWVIVAFHRAWVLGVGEGIGMYDVTTGEAEGSSPMSGELCAAPDDGFGSLWVPACGEGVVHRVDGKTGEVVASIPVRPSNFAETSVGAGEGGVWIVRDSARCEGCILVRIDPDRDRVAATYHIPEHGTAVRAGLGGIWISYPDDDQVLQIDPDSGKVVAKIDVGDEPRFLDVGLGGVWVMNQFDGSVSHIDPRSNEVVDTVAVDGGGISGATSRSEKAPLDPSVERAGGRDRPRDRARGGADRSRARERERERRRRSALDLGARRVRAVPHPAHVARTGRAPSVGAIGSARTIPRYPRR